MVLGNHALQRGYKPDELTDWFATAYVDGFRWVMPTNVVGMSQHADGGLLATKPYASGGAYINKMSDHCGDCAYDPKKRLGDDACPFTAGYWNFVHRNRDLLAKNNRTQRVVANMDRLKDLDAVLEQEAGTANVLDGQQPVQPDQADDDDEDSQRTRGQPPPVVRAEKSTDQRADRDQSRSQPADPVERDERCTRRQPRC